MENLKLSFAEVVIKNINCVAEGISTTKEAVGEILGAYEKEIRVIDDLSNLTVEEATKLYEMQGIYLHCGDGKVQYAAPVEVADCLSR